MPSRGIGMAAGLGLLALFVAGHPSGADAQSDISPIDSLSDDDVVNVGADERIATDVDNGHGVLSRGARPVITVDGMIETEGDVAVGIFVSAGENADVTLGGSIMTQGTTAYGIYTTGASTEITVTAGGRVETTGAMGWGIFSLEADTDITLSGVIMTEGSQAHGIVTALERAEITVTADGRVMTTGPQAYGIISQGVDAQITMDGTIETGAGENDADDTFGIWSNAASADITVGGTIMTAGARAYGIFSDGTNVPGLEAEDAGIVLTGTIMTSGEGAAGIVSTGADGADDDDVGAEITVDGMIVTGGERADGILSAGADAAITVGGTIITGARIVAGELTMTGGNEGSGVLSQAAGARIMVTRDGAIRTYGDVAPGIFVNDVATTSGVDEGADAVIDMAGTIMTVGRASHGIRSGGGDGADGDDIGAVIGVSGRIGTRGEGAFGIASQGDDAAITVTGAIETVGEDAFGISISEAADNNVMMAGTIRTAGEFAHGISSSRSVRTAITVTEDGRVELRGPRGSGIFSSSADAAITVDGTVRTTGSGSSGIYSAGVDAVITVDGMVRTTGMRSHGIHVAGGNAEITVSGKVHASGPDSYAIFGDDGDIRTLRLLRGSDIIGPIRTGLLRRLEIEEIGGHLEVSRTLRSELIVGTPRIVRTQPVLFDRGGGVVALVDPSASAIQRVMLAHVTRTVHSAVHSRGTAAQAAPAATDAGDGFDDRQAWVAAIGGDFERDADGGALGWDGTVYGAVVGVEGTLRSGVRAGVLGGYVRSEAATRAASIDADVSTAMLGIYGRIGGEVVESDGSWALTGALVGGYNDQDTVRQVHDSVVGRQVASGSHGSVFLSPSLGLQFSHPVMENHELRPSVRVDGLVARYGSYTEGGTEVSNVAYDSWKGVSASGRAQLGLATLLGPSAEFEARAGVTSRIHSGDDVSARLASGGGLETYDVPGDGSVFGGFVGGRLAWASHDGFSLAVDGEYGRSAGGERGLTGSLKLFASF